jgi:hypothetical protein
MSQRQSPDESRNAPTQGGGGLKRRDLLLSGSSLIAASALVAAGLTTAQAQQPQQPAPAPVGRKPNILMIMGDDIGWFNASIYHRGIMGYRTPNIDRIGNEGAMFTDWYGEQSCTAGRAAFITGQSPIRTGLTKVGLPGADVGIEQRTQRSPSCSSHSATRRGSSARTTSATRTNSCRPTMASTSSSATSTT